MLTRRWIAYGCSMTVALLLAYGFHRADRPSASPTPSRTGKDGPARAASPPRARAAAELAALNRLAWAAARAGTPAVTPSGVPENARAALDDAAQGERALMAEVWNLDEDQRRKFEEAVSKPNLERVAVYEHLRAGTLSQADFPTALAAADQRDSAELRAVLGSHYQEYTLMRGHFAEAGLDRQPFVPPTAATVLVDNP